MLLEDLKEYITTFDNKDKQMIDNKVDEQGLIECLNKQLIYLNCSRIINDMRMMQTIGYPYQREITTYLYLLDKCTPDIKAEYEEKLINLHKANLEYEKDNPPIWYGGKKAKAEWERKSGKLPRRKKVVQTTIAGFGKELSNSERLKQLSAKFGNLNFKLKTDK